MNRIINRLVNNERFTTFMKFCFFSCWRIHHDTQLLVHLEQETFFIQRFSLLCIPIVGTIASTETNGKRQETIIQKQLRYVTEHPALFKIFKISSGVASLFIGGISLGYTPEFRGIIASSQSFLVFRSLEYHQVFFLT